MTKRPDSSPHNQIDLHLSTEPRFDSKFFTAPKFVGSSFTERSTRSPESHSSRSICEPPQSSFPTKEPFQNPTSIENACMERPTLMITTFQFVRPFPRCPRLGNRPHCFKYRRASTTVHLINSYMVNNDRNMVLVHQRPVTETHENEPGEGAGLVLDDSRSDVSGLRLVLGDEGSPDPTPPSAEGCNTQHVSASSSRSNGQTGGGILKTVVVVAKGDPALCCSF